MAASASEYPLLSAQECIPVCDKHYLKIDITCDDCDKFICSKCAKTDHDDHDWKTIPTAGILRRKELQKTLDKVKEKNLKEIEEKILMSTIKMKDNQKYCESEVFTLQKHFDDIVSKINEIRKNFEKTLKENLDRKNATVSKKKIELENRKNQIHNLVEFLGEKHSTMSDYSLIDNLRDLSSIVSNCDCDLEKDGHSVRYRRGEISARSLESMMGQTLDLDDITVTETDSFRYGNRICIMEAINNDACFVRGVFSDYIEKVNKRNERKNKMNILVNDVCVTDNGDVYATNNENKSIVRLSPSGSVSPLISTAPLTPMGICQSKERGLLVILIDTESERYELGSKSRRLIRHVTLTGDVIREYEYQEDGQTRLFTAPFRIEQNGNTDICVLNLTCKTSGNLVILSFSGCLKTIYQGRNQIFQFDPTDAVCDAHCNIIVSDNLNNQVHLLSPDGEFMKCLLTDNEFIRPSSMSLYKSTLWVGNTYGLVKVFKYYNKT